MAVGNGRPQQAAAFRRRERVDFPLLLDPELRAYTAAGLGRGIAGGRSLARVWHHLRRALRAGMRQGRVQGDAWQLGGVFVLRSGETLFAHASREPGDPAPLDAVLKHLVGP